MLAMLQDRLHPSSTSLLCLLAVPLPPSLSSAPALARTSPATAQPSSPQPSSPSCSRGYPRRTGDDGDDDDA
eukprot:1004934-Alexandrium_andersonii.AAC.1